MEGPHRRPCRRCRRLRRLRFASGRSSPRCATSPSWSRSRPRTIEDHGRPLDPKRFTGLRRIGIDEFSYRKRLWYLTVVVDHDQRRVVWAGEGRSAQALAPFFELLGEEGCRAIETVTIDLSPAYIKAVRESLPRAEIVFDRFQVQRLASDTVEEVRRSLVRELAAEPDRARAVKRTRFVLLKNPWNPSRRQRSKPAEIQDTNRRL